jgi:hypothetical protein
MYGIFVCTCVSSIRNIELMRKIDVKKEHFILPFTMQHTTPNHERVIHVVCCLSCTAAHLQIKDKYFFFLIPPLSSVRVDIILQPIIFFSSNTYTESNTSSNNNGSNSSRNRGSSGRGESKEDRKVLD